jgi:small subunit ribosomal protein S17
MSRNVIQGTVVSDRPEKTVVVAVERRAQHRLYKKVITRTKRYHAHDENNECNLGDIVLIEECRPMSATKRWRVIQILTRGDVAEVQPEVIGRAIEESVAKEREDETDESSEAGESTTEAEQ